MGDRDTASASEMQPFSFDGLRLLGFGLVFEGIWAFV